MAKSVSQQPTPMTTPEVISNLALVLAITGTLGQPELVGGAILDTFHHAVGSHVFNLAPLTTEASIGIFRGQTNAVAGTASCM